MNIEEPTIDKYLNKVSILLTRPRKRATYKMLVISTYAEFNSILTFIRNKYTETVLYGCPKESLEWFCKMLQLIRYNASIKHFITESQMDNKYLPIIF